MARPKTITINYFPMECDLHTDEKMEMIIAEFGGKGESLYIKILSFGYANKGYYAEWDEAAQLRFLKRYSYYGFSQGFLNECVMRFFKWKLFDENLFNEFQILTSSRMQQTWLDATRSRHIGVVVTKMWLLGEFLQPKRGVFAAKMPQNKRDEIKEDESKGKDDDNPPPNFLFPDSPSNEDNAKAAFADPDFIYLIRQMGLKDPLMIDRVKSDFVSMRNGVGQISELQEFKRHFLNWLRKNIQRFTQARTPVANSNEHIENLKRLNELRKNGNAGQTMAEGQ